MAKVTRIPFNGMFRISYVYGDYNPQLNITADKRHHGIDGYGIGNKKVFSASRGKVIFAGWNSDGYGNLVKVQDGEYVHYYAHLEKIYVTVGQEVSFTTQIGIYGATGNVTGPHLHYEIRKNGVVINPATLMGIPNKEGTYNSYNYSFEENLRTKIYLPASVQKWRIYPLDKASVVGNEKGFLLPSKFGGLEYKVDKWISNDVAVITTRDFGQVQIYVGKDTAAKIS